MNYKSETLAFAGHKHSKIFKGPSRSKRTRKKRYHRRLVWFPRRPVMLLARWIANGGLYYLLLERVPAAVDFSDIRYDFNFVEIRW